MALETFKEFLIQQLNEIDPTIDTSVGSNFRDLLINPVSEVFSGFSDNLAQMQNRLNIEDLDKLSSAELDAFGKQFLITRNAGSYDIGKIRLYYSQPISIQIFSGQLFKNPNTGISYQALESFQVSKFLLTQNYDEETQLYFTDEISISTLTKVDNGSLNVGAKLTSSLNPVPIKIEVTTEVFGGDAQETDAEFLERIKNSIKTSSLASESVLQSKITGETTVELVDVVGAGDAFMKRDLVEYAPLTGKTVENFQYVLSGTSNDLKSKGHAAYVNNFVVSAVTSSGTGADVIWPTSPQSWTDEFSNELYRGIYTLDDGDYATQDQYQIISVPAWSADYFEGMSKADGIEPKNLLIWADEIRLNGTQVLLGKTPSSIDFKNVQIPVNQLQQVQADLEAAAQAADWAAVLHLSSLLAQKTLPESYANLSPILYKKIAQHTGITIDTRMSTTDGTAWGEMAYVTVLRNDQIHMAHDGYGLAWRKQPDFLIRLNYDNYTDQALRAADIATFIELFDIDPVANNLIGNDILKTGLGNDQYWFYNTYLVDNNVLQEETFTGTNRVFDAINGINQYLQRGKYWIEPNILYDFKIEIQTTLATNIYVKPALSGSFTLVASKGATYPAYVPASGYKIVTGNSQVNALDASAGNVGIAVGETKGWEWTVHDFFVRSIVQTFPMHLFKFKIDLDKWENSAANFSVDYWGVGYDPNRYALEGYTGNSRTQAAIWDPVNEEWELIGTSVATIASSLESKKITKEFGALASYMDLNDYIYIVASAANFGTSYEDNVDHNLLSYYVQISNPEAGEKHLGNMVDAWCFESGAISEKAVNGIVSNGTAVLSEPYMCDVVEVREQLSQVVIPATEYVIYNSKPKESNSADNELKLIFSSEFNGTGVTAIIRKWDTGANVAALLNDPENKYPATSIKEKASPLAIVKITNLEYSGTIEVEQAKEILINLINSNSTSVLEKSDLIATLYQVGADYVNLDMEIEIKYHNFEMFAQTEEMGNRFTLPDRLCKFYTNVDLLDGVTKI